MFFDGGIQFDSEQELLKVIDEFVIGFHRQRAEPPLRFYVRFLDVLVKKLRVKWTGHDRFRIRALLSFLMQLQHGAFRPCVPARVPVFSVFVDPDALHHMFGLDAKLNPCDAQRVNS